MAPSVICMFLRLSSLNSAITLIYYKVPSFAFVNFAYFVHKGTQANFDKTYMEFRSHIIR